MEWAITLALGAPAALFILLTWVGLWAFLVNRPLRLQDAGFSFCPPVLWGVLGAAACIVCPWPETWRWAWAPLVLDPSIPLMLFSAVTRVARGLTPGRHKANWHPRGPAS